MKINLKGVAIGDGWTDPPNQFNFYDSLLYSAGIASNKFRDVCTWFQTQGITNLLKENYANVFLLLSRRLPILISWLTTTILRRNIWEEWTIITLDNTAMETSLLPNFCNSTKIILECPKTSTTHLEVMLSTKVSMLISLGATLLML